MPWEHCGLAVNDDRACPTCGTTKAQWTVEFDTPRTLKVSRRPLARFHVVARGSDVAIPGVAWRATLPDGSLATGETDELGTARVQCSGRGTYALELPEVAPASLIAVTPPAEAALAGDPPGRLRLVVGTPYRIAIEPGLALKVVHDGRPLAGRRYRLVLGDDEDAGRLDDDGIVRATIPASVSEGELFVDDGAGGELRLALAFGDLVPPTDVRGVQQRLNNLGWTCGDEDGDHGPVLGAALRAFQRASGLDPTGALDDATRRKLVDMHGS